MANEARNVELTNSTGFPRRVFVADTPAILKNTLLALTGARTGIAPTTSGQPCAGITLMDKEASDGSLSISVITNCIADLKVSGALTAGDPIQMTGDSNIVELAIQDVASGAVLMGYSMEDATDGQTKAMRIML